MAAGPLRTQIEDAALRVTTRVRQTPVLTTRLPGMDRSISLKFEQMQHTGSFKVRGAFNSLTSQAVPAAGVVAASGGNHGAAVGYAARALGHKAHIFVPEAAGPAKIALIRETGAELTVLPGVYADVVDAARDEAQRTGAIQIHAYDAPATVAGQGTLAREWDLQRLEADTILVAVGGGGLIGGFLGWFGTTRNVVAVEPELCPTLHDARLHGPDHETAASGLGVNALGARTIGRICYDMAEQFDTPTVLVPDAAIAEAQTLLWRGLRQLVEPAGATALAPLLCGAYLPEPDERVAVLICGGNIAPDPLAG